MIQKILIANRGEIALRIAKTCRKLGIKTLAIYSDADKDMPYVKYCDEAIALNGNQLSETYLNGDRLINIAKNFNCDAIHPGYGFLSENAEFAQACKEAEVIFIGPQPNVIEQMGDKKNARKIAQKANVPVVPGYDGAEQDAKKLKSEAKKIGFPILLKASAGGGGKGMRIVRKEKDLEKELAAAKNEAKNAFGNDKILLEKYFEKVRHIEVQIIGDQHKNIIHLNERDCSVQRRYQKIIEESPSPALNEKQRNEICNAALKLAKELHYQNAGTVEFIYDEISKAFYFLEVNTRLQVEHPVTESITGLDLVEWQICISEGKKLTIQQSDIELNGHAIECRIYAENPYNDFAPATGEVIAFEFPEMEGLRLDYGVRAGNKIDVFYDPMIAKVITHGADRNEALRKMYYALSNASIIGPENNRYFLQSILQDPDFINGETYTHFLQDKPELFDQVRNQKIQELAIVSAAAKIWYQRNLRRKTFSGVPSGWRNLKFSLQKEIFKIDETEIQVEYEIQGEDFLAIINETEYLLESLVFNKNTCAFNYDNVRYQFTIHKTNKHLIVSRPGMYELKLKRVNRFPKTKKEKIPGNYHAPMPGEITKVLVKKGDKVKSGDALLLLVSMKMENTIEAQEDGIVSDIYVKSGDFTEADTALLKLDIEQ